MLELPDDVTLFNLARNLNEAASLVRLTRHLAADRIDGQWWRVEVSASVRAQEGDHHWRWRQIVGMRRQNAAWESLAIQSSNGAIEGAISYRIDALSQIDRGGGAIYADRLATAPRNRPWLVKSPKYRGVGTVLLMAAVRHSYSLGLGGRVRLSSLPSERTRDFYTRRGFQVTFDHGDGTLEYELPSATAVAWLEEQGYL